MVFRIIASRFAKSFVTIPTLKNWSQTVHLLIVFALIYLPIGFGLGFLRFQPELEWHIVLSVTVGALFMPALLEEIVFRIVLIPHPTESVERKSFWIFVGFSWLIFLLYHLHPLTPIFFRQSVFVVGAGLLGAGCTVSFLQSGSLWTPVFMHWVITVIWLIFLGGLEKFRA